MKENSFLSEFGVTPVCVAAPETVHEAVTALHVMTDTLGCVSVSFSEANATTNNLIVDICEQLLRSHSDKEAAVLELSKRLKA